MPFDVKINVLSEEHHMNIGLFTYITGIATILGLFLQIKDVFPQHRETRKNVIFTILGVFIGTLIVSFQGINITLAVPLSGLGLLVGAIIVVLFFVLMAAAFTSDNQKRDHLLGASFGIGFLLCIILFGYFLSQSPHLASQKITNDELLLLSDSNREKGNFEKSIYFLEKVKENLSSGDPRSEILKDKISELKKMQIGDKK